ncbi:hypothetical protein BBP00_00004886 [Phytophthora kernoviae]|uniref:WW domain-containing protein n=1 Tax=Phytophthora kernoviae TaxID=325452 RepID=A0A3F2RRZ3_9STRA|nr:hypothetical protein BBP00_00004886 [Phytophthora kernoviae]
MRTDANSVSARVKKKKRSSERSKRLDKMAEGSADGEWKQFTSPDSHPYYYNAVTKESRWELPTTKTRSKHRRTKGNSSKHIAAEVELDVSTALKAVHSEEKEAGDDADTDKSAVKPKSAMFQKLQASLEGKLNVMPSPMMGRPPMVSIRREEDSYSGGAVTVEMETRTQTLEEQYEAETANMSAAERLRFLRRKRQEEMLAKKASVAEDDFMAEFANNMKKKEATRKPKQEEATGDKAQQWKEQEAAEEERKKQQMMEEREVKEQEAQRKEREQQAAMERENQREQERAEQFVLEQQREEERKQRQEEQERARQANEDTNMKKMKKVKDQLLEEIVQDDTNHESHDDRKSGITENEVQDSVSSLAVGYHLMPPSLPPSSDGVVTPSALIPYSADATFQNAYGYGMPFGQQAAPELSRCECCQGIGVGLAEKNRVCAHCNRLRLAFIVDSAQMRQRCSVCGGWGFCLLQANAPPRRFSTENSVKTDGMDDIEWDKSSSNDDSDWDD